MNSGTNDVTCYRAYLPDALRLRFEDNLSIRAIAQHLNLSHSTVHVLFQRFIASGIKWPLPETLSFTQLDQMLFTNRKRVIVLILFLLILVMPNGVRNVGPATAVNLKSTRLSRHYSRVLLLLALPENTASMITCCLTGKTCTKMAC